MYPSMITFAALELVAGDGRFASTRPFEDAPGFVDIGPAGSFEEILLRVQGRQLLRNSNVDQLV
jgi:hypothetical protein